ncbi:MAG TPA: TetR/AcrR family transcriptional regulator [bacterium]|nr:TetR/AcrR family transcriptional regulator [bacterium]
MAQPQGPSATRDRILSAAMEVFARKGYHAAGVEDIVRASGTSKGAFYHYFPSKRGIFLTLMDDLAALVEQGVEAVIAQERGAVAKVEAALRVVIETAAEQRALVKILLLEAVGLGPAFEQKRLEIHSRFARVIQHHLDRAVQEGDIPPQDTALVAQAWMGALTEVIAQWLTSGGPSLRAKLPQLRALLLRSIGAKADAPGDR